MPTDPLVLTVQPLTTIRLNGIGAECAMTSQIVRDTRDTSVLRYGLTPAAWKS